MTRDVTVIVSGLHMDAARTQDRESLKKDLKKAPDGDGLQTIRTEASGNYYFRGGKHYIMYEETSEDISGTVKNTIKIDGSGIVEIKKSGAAAVTMVFQEGNVSRARYRNAFGEFLLEIYTEFLEVTKDEQEIRVRICYRLEAGGAPVSDCEVCIHIISQM